MQSQVVLLAALTNGQGGFEDLIGGCQVADSYSGTIAASRLTGCTPPQMPRVTTTPFARQSR